MKVTCNVIRDLLPLYVEKLCSIDSIEIIEEHIRECSECQSVLALMIQPVMSIELDNDETLKAKRPFEKIKKRNRIRIAIGIAIAVALTIIFMMMVNDIGVLNDFFFPKKIVVMQEENSSGRWEKINIDGSYYLVFDSIFYKKMLTNSANSVGTVKIRILDEYDNVIIEELLIEAGTSESLKELQNNTRYVVECFRNEQGFYTLNFH